MDDYRTALRTTGWISLALPGVVAFCRLLERSTTRKLGEDDGCVVVAYVSVLRYSTFLVSGRPHCVANRASEFLTLACSICVEQAATLGFGQHITDVDGLHNRTFVIRLDWVASILLSCSGLFARCSTVISIMRVSKTCATLSDNPTLILHSRCWVKR